MRQERGRHKKLHGKILSQKNKTGQGTGQEGATKAGGSAPAPTDSKWQHTPVTPHPQPLHLYSKTRHGARRLQERRDRHALCRAK